jgi:hypothetical protein
MKKAVRSLAVAAILVLAVGICAAAEEITMKGGFVWEREDGNHDGDLTAVFTPAGDGQWKVAFHFDWEDGPHVYTGTCEGSLTGELSGTVQSDGEDNTMNFKFDGEFQDGTFTGTHAFVTKEGEIKDGGTLTLAAN